MVDKNRERSARSSGWHYDTPEKDRYRRETYDYVSSFFGRYTKQDKRIAILDTTAALETIQAVRAGFLPENIYVVNGDIKAGSRAAWKASFTRSLRKAGIDGCCRLFPGEDLLRVIRTSCSSPSFINYDSCAPIGGDSWMNYVNQLASSLCGGGLFGLTVMAGRERADSVVHVMGNYAAKWGDGSSNLVEEGPRGMVGGNHRVRLTAIHQALSFGSIGMACHAHALVRLYRSARVPMLQCAFRIVQRHGFPVWLSPDDVTHRGLAAEARFETWKHAPGGMYYSGPSTLGRGSAASIF
jgi:hypothetical protein